MGRMTSCKVIIYSIVSCIVSCVLCTIDTSVDFPSHCIVYHLWGSKVVSRNNRISDFDLSNICLYLRNLWEYFPHQSWFQICQKSDLKFSEFWIRQILSISARRWKLCYKLTIFDLCYMLKYLWQSNFGKWFLTLKVILIFTYAAA